MIEFIIIIVVIVLTEYRINKKEINISYKIKKKSWIEVNLVMFCLTLILSILLILLMIEIEDNLINISSNRFIRGFIKEGGLVILLMILVNIINRFLVQSKDLDYLLEYTPNISKINYSLAFFVACYILIRIDEKIVADNGWDQIYFKAVMCLVVVITIWLGFGSLSVSRKDRDTIKSKILKAKKFMKNSGMCSISLVIGPIIAIIMFECTSDKNIDRIRKIDIVPIVIILSIFFVIKILIICYRNSMIHNRIIISKLKEGSYKKGTYKNMKYEIKLIKNNYEITIFAKKITINKKNIDKTVMGEIEKIQKDKQKDSLNNIEETLSFLKEESKEIKRILRNAFEKVKENYFNKL